VWPKFGENLNKPVFYRIFVCLFTSSARLKMKTACPFLDPPFIKQHFRPLFLHIVISNIRILQIESGNELLEMKYL
jgi:hypothetical protein